MSHSETFCWGHLGQTNCIAGVLKIDLVLNIFYILVCKAAGCDGS